VEVYRATPGAFAPPAEDIRKCVRCLDRKLPLPHPRDHLCEVCRRECPYCDRPTDTGGVCRGCRRACLVCAKPLDDVGDEAWCVDCRSTREAGDPFLRVVSAFPAPLARACRYRYTPEVAQEIHVQVRRHGAARLVDRMHRRWFERWAHVPLTAETVHEVALELVRGGECAAGCEDGFTARGDFCPVCRPGNDRPQRTYGGPPPKAAEGARALGGHDPRRPVREAGHGTYDAAVRQAQEDRAARGRTPRPRSG
jgi:hypothetical protein